VNQPSDSLEALSDNDLLQRHLDGDRQAFAALTERYRKEVYVFLAHFTGDRTLAEDVFQETFLQLHLSAATFDVKRPLKPWLFTIAANKARDALRKRGRRQMAPLDARIGGPDGEAGTYADLMPADVPAPLENLLNQERRQVVQDMVGQLPDKLRTVLVLAYFNGMPYNEIAETVGAPLGTVKSRLHTAVRIFAAKWKAVARRSGHDTTES